MRGKQERLRAYEFKRTRISRAHVAMYNERDDFQIGSLSICRPIISNNFSSQFYSLPVNISLLFCMLLFSVHDFPVSQF